jgi:uncharacterized protein YbaA (DUF1428 family)
VLRAPAAPGFCRAAVAKFPRPCRIVGATFVLSPTNREETEMPYVDGFVLAVPKANFDAYKDLARMAGVVWKDHGAIDYVEAIGDDVPYGELTSFPRAVQAKDDEVVVFAWVTYQDRQHRDEVMKKVMADPRLKHDRESMPFDGKRMIFGGFQSFVEM